jgi:hypothetical protein
MKAFRGGLSIAFFFATLFGAVAIIPIAIEISIWVLWPLGVALCGFIAYFLSEEP